MNVRFVIRGLLLTLPTALLIVSVWAWLHLVDVRLLSPPPPPPAIDAPRGEPPSGPVSFQEWAYYQDAGYRLGGSGFLLRLGNGEVLAVTTAHGASPGSAEFPLAQIAFQIAGQAGYVGEFDTLRGLPGHLFTRRDMSTDYTLLQTNQPFPPEMVLSPDPRGGPLPGERVTLFAGVDGSRREGTVHTVGATAVWVQMDESFDPSLMSGSPLVSQHTGQVVGMAVAATSLVGKLYLGLNPIGALVQHADSATEFLKIIKVRK